MSGGRFGVRLGSNLGVDFIKVFVKAFGKIIFPKEIPYCGIINLARKKSSGSPNNLEILSYLIYEMKASGPEE